MTMRFMLTVTMLALIGQSASAQSITVIDSNAYAVCPAGYVAAQGDFKILDAFPDSDDFEASVWANATASDSAGGALEANVFADANVDPLSGIPAVILDSSIDLEISGSGVLVDGAISFSANSEASATLQLNAANPLDDVEVRVQISGGLTPPPGGSCTDGYFGFDFDGDNFDAMFVNNGAGLEWDDFENNMDFDFTLVGYEGRTVEEEFYVMLDSGTQVEVSCHTDLYGSPASYNIGSPLALISDAAGVYAWMSVEIIP